jgi:hypothetical protein
MVEIGKTRKTLGKKKKTFFLFSDYLNPGAGQAQGTLIEGS